MSKIEVFNFNNIDMFKDAKIKKLIEDRMFYDNVALNDKNRVWINGKPAIQDPYKKYDRVHITGQLNKDKKIIAWYDNERYGKENDVIDGTKLTQAEQQMIIQKYINGEFDVQKQLSNKVSQDKKKVLQNQKTFKNIRHYFETNKVNELFKNKTMKPVNDKRKVHLSSKTIAENNNIKL